MNTITSKHKFNAIDAIIIAVIILVIAGAIAFFAFGSAGASNSSVKIEYVIELRTIRNEFKDNIIKGDKIIDSVAKYSLGEVIDVSTSDAIYNGTNKVTGTPTVSKYPDHSNINITVVSSASIDSNGRYIIDGGYDISVGTTVHMRVPNFTGTGYCIMIREMEDAQ